MSGDMKGGLMAEMIFIESADGVGEFIAAGAVVRIQPTEIDGYAGQASVIHLMNGDTVVMREAAARVADLVDRALDR